MSSKIPSRKNLSRRRFLAATAAGLSAPMVVTSPIFGNAARRAANERITIGLIGAGKRGNTLLRQVLPRGQAQVVAVAEVEGRRLEDRAQRVEKHYQKEHAAGKYDGCARTTDFRELLDRKDLDAVIIATPDHWHSIPLVEAAKRKLDVFCEKPLTLTLHESKKVIEAVRKYDIVLQTGSQQRSECGGRFHKACELVRNGRIGKVREVWVNVGEPSIPCNLPEFPTPGGTDWEMWLGSAPWRGYNEELCPYGIHGHYPNFRLYKEYSGGMMTDWGAHHFDIAQWGLGRDGSGPVKITPPNGKDVPYLTYEYEDGVRMYRTNKYKGENIDGLRFVGDDGMVQVNRGSFKTWPESVGKETIGDDETRLYKASSHMGNWLECVETRKDPICRIEVGAGSAAVCHLGNLAYWNERPLRWDPKKWEFLGDEDANSQRDRERHRGWKLEV